MSLKGITGNDDDDGGSVSVIKASFLVKYGSMKDKNDWITQGIRNLVANTE